MSEEQNIDQSRDDRPQSTENENISEPSTVNYQPSTNMEAHHSHHPTHKKKWTEYLLEFFMLFLAVFLGFVAENFRESQTDRSKEKEFIESLIIDLRYDTLQYGKTIKNLQRKIICYDSVLSFLKKPSSFNNNLPYRFWAKTSSEQFYSPTEQTIEQMKSTGGLRLIHKKGVLDSILKYDSHVNGDYKNQTEYEIEFSKRMVGGMEKIFDFSALNILLDDALQNSDNKNASGYDLRLISANNDLIQEVYNLHISSKGADFFYINTIESTKKIAINLIAFLQKEYHLQNE